MGHRCGTKSEKFLISPARFPMCENVCVRVDFRMQWRQSYSYLILQALSYLTNSICLCLLNNQSDSEQPDISHPLAHCRMGIDLHNHTLLAYVIEMVGGRRCMIDSHFSKHIATCCIPWVSASSHGFSVTGDMAYLRRTVQARGTCSFSSVLSAAVTAENTWSSECVFINEPMPPNF